MIVEKDALLPGTEIVNVVPQPKAGGSFATTMYHRARCPVAVEEIKADAGMDIGDTLIGMQLKKVAVPVRPVSYTHLTGSDDVPKTSDENNIMLWAAMMIVSSAACAGMMVKRRKSEK